MFEALLGASLLLNLTLFLLLIKKNKKAPKQESYEVRELLHDLTGGAALIRLERIAPADVFLRSPKQR